MSLTSARDVDPLTLTVLRSLADGHTDREIAERHHVSPRTVQRVIDTFKSAAGARTRFAAGAAACRWGLLDTPPRERTDTA